MLEKEMRLVPQEREKNPRRGWLKMREGSPSGCTRVCFAKPSGSRGLERG